MWRTVSLSGAAALILALAVSRPALAAYVVIDTFESYSAGDINGQSDGSGTWTAHTDFEVATDPTDASNQVLSLLSNGSTCRLSDTVAGSGNPALSKMALMLRRIAGSSSTTSMDALFGIEAILFIHSRNGVSTWGLAQGSINYIN